MRSIHTQTLTHSHTRCLVVSHSMPEKELSHCSGISVFEPHCNLICLRSTGFFFCLLRLPGQPRQLACSQEHDPSQVQAKVDWPPARSALLVVLWVRLIDSIMGITAACRSPARSFSLLMMPPCLVASNFTAVPLPIGRQLFRHLNVKADVIVTLDWRVLDSLPMACN